MTAARKKYLVYHINRMWYSDGRTEDQVVATYTTYASSKKKAVSNIRFREKIKTGNYGMAYDESWQSLLTAEEVL